MVNTVSYDKNDVRKMSIVSNSTRITGIFAILVGFIISLTGIGLLIGIPIIIFGFAMFLPEVIIFSVVASIVMYIIAVVYFIIH